MTTDDDPPRPDLLTLSHELGLESRGLTILAEGNTSARVDADTFLVKASGHSLGTLTPAGLVRCRFAPLLALVEGNSADGEPGPAAVEAALSACRVAATDPRPSVECLFHAFLLTLPGVGFVGHAHPVRAGAILCAADPELAAAFAAERRFPDEVICCDPVSLWLPYADPGLGLARVIAAGVREFRRDHGRPPRVVLLESHGVITLGASAAAVLTAMRMTEKAAAIFTAATALAGGRRPRALPPAEVARLYGRPDEEVRRRVLNL